MLKIFYGRSCVDKENFIYKSMRDGLNDAEKVILLVPEQFTLEAEKSLLTALGAKGMIDIEVLSISRLSSRIFEELGGGRRRSVDKYGRHMLMTKIIDEKKDSLRLYKGMASVSSFVAMANDMIYEMKQYDKTADDISKIIEGMSEDSILKRKLEDIHTIYSDYEEYMKDRYLDGEDITSLLISKLASSKLVRRSIFWVDGFDYFTPKNIGLMGELMVHSKGLNVVFTSDTSCADSEAFEITQLMMHRLSHKAAELGTECEIKKMPEVIRKTGDGIAALEKALYAIPFEPYRAKASHESHNVTGEERENIRQSAPDIKLVKAANVYAEAETAAAEVMHLTRDKGMRYRDIVLICNDMEGRASIIKRVFDEYGIDIFMDRKRSVLQNPTVAFILYLLDTVQKGMRSSDVLGMLKTAMTDVSAEQIEELENYAIKYKIKGSKWKKTFDRGEFEYEPERLAEIENTRAYAAGMIGAFEKGFKKAKTAADKTAELYAFLRDTVHMPQRIEELVKEEREAGHYEAADEAAQIWKISVNLLEQINSIIGEEEISAESFAAILKSGFEAVEIGVLPPAADGLMMGTMQRTRIGNIRALLVLGANEGILPSGSFGESLLNDDEKQRLFKENIEVSKLDELKAKEERLGIYKNLTKPSEYLYMSCSLADAEGNKQRTSSVFDKLARIFPENEIQADIIEQQQADKAILAETRGAEECGSGMNLLQSSRSALKHLTRALRKNTEGERLDSQWQAVLDWYKQEDIKDLALVSDGLFFENREERFGKSVVDGLYKSNDGSLTVSPSALEKYSRCAFAHFITYGLKPEERRVFEVAGREIGDIYHQCLMEVSEKLTQKGIEVTAECSPWMTIERESIEKMVSDFVDAEAANYRGGIFQSGAEEEYRKERIKGVCSETAWALVNHVRQGEIASAAFEEAFGRSSAKPLAPIEVKIGGETAYIEGKIDRVDELRGGRVKIIDYKTGNEKFDVAEVRSGYRLQLMIYLKAAQEHKRGPAGVFYFKVDESLPPAGNKKSFKLDGVMVNDPEVIEGIAGVFDGFSEIAPVRKDRQGNISGTSQGRLLSGEEFAELQQAVDDKLSELCGKLAEGRVAAEPMKARTATACDYCEYRSICLFDKAISGCAFVG